MTAKATVAGVSADSRPIEAGAHPLDRTAEPTQPSGPARSVRRTRPYQQRKDAPTARVTTATGPSISKAQEYVFIREDLRRLLLTAGILTVVMIALLIGIGR